MTRAATAPVPAPTPAPIAQPTGPPSIRPNSPAHNAPESAERPGVGSTVSRTVVLPESSFLTKTASSNRRRPLAPSRVAAVRNSWAR